MRQRKLKTKKNKKVEERPLDPTRNAADFFGDTTGLTGITEGSNKRTSAEPTAEDIDTEHLPGGIIEDDKKPVTVGIPREVQSDKIYNKRTLSNMSPDRAKINEELASEPEENSAVDSKIPDKDEEEMLDDNKEHLHFTRQNRQSRFTNTEDADHTSPAEQGEVSVSGTTPDVESDDNTEENEREVGLLDNTEGEDVGNPQEIDIAEKIDKAEEDYRTH